MREEIDVLRSLGVDTSPVTPEVSGRAQARLVTEIELERSRRRSPSRLRRTTRRGRLVIVLAILALGGAAAVARTIFNLNPTEVASLAIRCEEGTGNNTTGSGYEFFASDLRSEQAPVAACRQMYRKRGPAALARPDIKLIACAENAGDGVVVYVATGKPGQCQSLGMYPLPTGYTAVQTRIFMLARALGAVYRRHDCVSPATLAREAQGVLDRLGFSDWHTRQMLLPPNQSDGPCGTFPGGGTPHGDVASDPAAALAMYAPDRVVIIQNGRPRSMSRLIEATEPRLTIESGRRCYALTAARALVLKALASAHVPVVFATTAAPNGEAFGGGRQRRYDRGCTIIISVNTGADGHTVQAWLGSKSALPNPAAQGPPGPGAYSR